MFPSGHTGILFLMFLLIKEEANSKYWALILLLSAILEAIFMIFSRGHYTLDVLGAIFVAYAIHAFSKKNLKKRLLR